MYSGGSNQRNVNYGMNINKGTAYGDAFAINPESLARTGIMMSDEDPRSRIVPEHNTIIRKTRIFISDKAKNTATQVPEQFSVNVNFPIKNIRYIKPIQIQVTYTVTATTVINGLVYFPDFDNSEITSNGRKFHAYFPITQANIGVQVLFNFNFNNDYITEFKNLNSIKNKLSVEVYTENSLGTYDLFTQLDAFAVELEINYIDPSYKDTQIL